MVGLNRTLFELTVAESDRGRAYWAERPWLANEERIKVRDADILVVPWVDFRPSHPVLFPSGTGDVVRSFSSELAGKLAVALAGGPEQYQEVALHADEWRLPTFFTTAVVLPMFVQVLSNHIDRWLTTKPNEPTVQVELLIETAPERCFSIKYKGPPSEAIKTIIEKADACISAGKRQRRAGRK